LSIPLQDGVWLLRRLRPLSCTLAFSRPVTGTSSVRVPQFRTNVFQQCVAASYTPGVCGFPFPLFIRTQKEPSGIVPHLEGEEMRPTALSFWTKCLSHFHFSILTALQTEVSLVSIDRRGSTSLRLAPDIRHIVSGLHTPKNAVLRRMPLPPYIAIQM
jgi:hypothetical protein